MTEMRRSGSGTGVQLKPHLDKVTPDHGSTTGGQEIVLTGTGLEDIVRVRFGQEEATDVRSTGPTRVTCTLPPNDHGQCKVVAFNSEDMKSNERPFMYD